MERQFTTQELEQMLKAQKKQDQEKRIKKQQAYNELKADCVNSIKKKVLPISAEILNLFKFVEGETSAFKDVMFEYSKLKTKQQMSFSIKEKDFKVVVKGNKVKKFDERADIAATALIEFLEEWIQGTDKGIKDPMYQLAMTLLERNKTGELDYKSISKLYELEANFNNERYSEIMALFRESNIIEGTATNYYFERLDERGVWRKIEVNFNRM
ncbi:MAG: DUF3164 family protein [Marinifilaceae bacterium]|jgi:hypothetical protein|nr:DUF3164 family protein [Marinifilaceae bacterium]